MIPRYRLTGPDGARTIVLSNSLGTDSTMWDDQIPALSERFRVLRYDQRGHGETPAAPGPYALDDLGTDVLDLLDHLGLQRVHFAGLSLGGMIGVWLATHAPERLDRLALLCTSAALPPAPWIERAAFVREHGTAALVDSTLGRWFTERAARCADVTGRFAAMLTHCSDEGYAACCEAIAGMDLLAPLPGITAPTLVLSGRDDPATPPEHGARIARATGAQWDVLDDAAHLANVERADAVTRLLLEHFTAQRHHDAEHHGTEGEHAMSDDTSRYRAGMATRREVLGAEHVDRAEESTTEFTAGFQDFITRYAWGEVWRGEGVDRRTRSCLTLAILAALGIEKEFAMHVRAALRNGVPAEHIREVLMHVALYAGLPRANAAFAIANTILSEQDET